jgi:hypothetical protein
MGSVEGYISTFLEQLICSSQENSKEKKTIKGTIAKTCKGKHYLDKEGKYERITQEQMNNSNLCLYDKKKKTTERKVKFDELQECVHLKYAVCSPYWNRLA